VDDGSPEGGNKRQQKHCRIAVRKLWTLIMYTKRLIPSLWKQMMVCVTLKFEQHVVGNNISRLPRMLGSKLLDDAGLDFLALKTIMFNVVYKL
jgi:hypothetical protein